MTTKTKRQDISESKPMRVLYPVDEALELLGGISRATLYRRIDDGVVRVVHLGGRTFIAAAEIERLARGEAA